jgi:hypothetical protein
LLLAVELVVEVKLAALGRAVVVVLVVLEQALVLQELTHLL